MLSDLLAFNSDPVWNVTIRFFVTLLVLFIVIRGIYHKYNKTENYQFSFYLIGIMIFFVCILLKTVEIQMGIAFGLFALFALLRFRSLNLPMKNMAYLFTVIGISVINALANFLHPVRGPILINSLIILSAFILEVYFRKTTYSKLRIVYNNLELLDPKMIKELLNDLSIRTGSTVEKVEIRKIDFIKGNAELDLYFKEYNNRVK
jgi:hypothetical protein